MHRDAPLTRPSVGASSAIQVLTAAEGAAPYTLQSIGNTGFLAIASPGKCGRLVDSSLPRLYAHPLSRFRAALLFVPYVNPATASVLLSPAGVVADPVGERRRWLANGVLTHMNTFARA